MVFAETLSADKLIDRLPHASATETTGSTEVSSQSVEILWTGSQWKKILSDGTNKGILAEFLYVVWRDADLTAVGKDLSLYIAHGNLCHCVTVMEGLQTFSDVEDLTCDHEECDTRVFLHSQHAALPLNYFANMCATCMASHLPKM